MSTCGGPQNVQVIKGVGKNEILSLFFLDFVLDYVRLSFPSRLLITLTFDTDTFIFLINTLSTIIVVLKDVLLVVVTVVIVIIFCFECASRSNIEMLKKWWY